MAAKAAEMFKFIENVFPTFSDTEGVGSNRAAERISAISGAGPGFLCDCQYSVPV
jgi:pyrroline-5-carboxylate reductase